MSTDTDAARLLPNAPATLVSRQRALDESAYDRVFWFTYLANGLTTVANAMLVRYSDFVQLLGGEEKQLGLIVGFGMLGSIAMRFVQGVCIDRYGAARIWQWSMGIYAASLFAHLSLTTAHGPGVFLTRAIMQTSLAGVFGSSITFVSLRVSPPRVAEMIGALGTSGFIGILVGPQISDLICRGHVIRYGQIQLLFLTAATMATLATLATCLATTGDAPPVARRQPGLGRLLNRYTPWSVALVAAAMGAGFAIPMTFLRPFATDQGIASIGLFFAMYAGTALVARILTRNLFERHGNRPWIIGGMVLLTVSFVLYLPVTRAWHLIMPGAVAGIAHAVLFPSIMSEGTTAFPRRFRGVATSLMLAMFDFGTFLGAPVVGALVHYLKRSSSAAYGTAFTATAAVLLLSTVGFWLHSATEPDRS